MSHYPSESSTELEFVPWQPTRIPLSPESLQWVVQQCEGVESGVSLAIASAPHLWSVFLQTMALRGVQQWLEDYSDNWRVMVDATRLSSSGGYCQVGDFQVYVLAMGSLTQETVPIPGVVVERNNTHAYLLVEVHEETDEITILNSVGHAQLKDYQQQSLLTVVEGGYAVPLRYFDISPDRLLLYFTCLNPAVLLGEALAEANSGEEAGENADLVSAVDLSSVVLNAEALMINVRQWLQGQMDSVAQALDWVLIPPLAPANAIMTTRTPQEELEAILRSLEPNGVVIPLGARGAFVDVGGDDEVNVGGDRPLPQQPFRLYSVTWLVPNAEVSEWSLFLILMPTTGRVLRPGTRLMVQDQDAVLSDTPVESALSSSALQEDVALSQFIYTQVVGTWNEQFIVTVIQPDGTMVTWPPFGFGAT